MKIVHDEKSEKLNMKEIKSPCQQLNKIVQFRILVKVARELEKTIFNNQNLT